MLIRFSVPVVYAISDGSLTDENFYSVLPATLQAICNLAESGTDLYQIREKNISAKKLYELAVKTREITRRTQTKILINDRADIALAANADGVHLATSSINTKFIRNNFPSDFVIGVSTHNETELETAFSEKADFAVFSPIFPTKSKEKYGAPQGINKLHEICDKYKNFPIIALGGINESNLSACLSAGAKGIAGISLFRDVIKAAEIIKNIKREND